MNVNSVSTLLPGMMTALLALLTYLGTYKYVIEPWLLARQLRKKYATALWITCRELQLHLENIHKRVSVQKQSTINALKKIPNNDFKDRVDWFTKEGYYASVTAYKIAVVSAWLRVYQQELLFSTYRKSRKFLNSLYGKADQIKSAFSKDTCLWYDYFDAIGDKLVDRSGDVPRPLAFSTFCDKCFSEKQYRLFYEQLRIFIWFVANGEYLEKLDKIGVALEGLRDFLKRENLLKGFEIERPTINPELSRPSN